MPPGVTVTGIPARVLMARDKTKGFVAYGMPCDDDLPDPVARAIDSLRTQLVATTARVEELEAELARRDAEAGDDTADEDRPAAVGGGS